MKKGFIQKTFGKKFGIYDFILLTIILGFPIYIIFTKGFAQLIEDFAGYIWIGIFVGYLSSILVRRAKK